MDGRHVRRSLRKIIETGVARGDLRPEARGSMVSGVGFDMIISRYLVRGIAPDEAMIDKMMESVMIPLMSAPVPKPD